MVEIVCSSCKNEFIPSLVLGLVSCPRCGMDDAQVFVISKSREESNGNQESPR